MPTNDLFAPGEADPATVEPGPPPAVADVDQPTGTEMDDARDIPDMDESDIERALAAAMRGEELPEDPPSKADEGSAAPTSAPADQAPDQSIPPADPVPGAAPTASDPPAAAPHPDTPAGATAAPPTVIEIPGIGTVTPEQAQEITQLYQWAQSLDPTQAQAITDLLSGGYALTPRTPDTPAASGPGVTPSAGGVGAPAGGVTNPLYAPAAPTITPPPDFDPSQYADPELARMVHDQQTALANLAAQQQAATQAQAQAQARQVQQEQARLQAEADIATAEFASTHGLDEATSQRLVQTAVSMQVIPSLYAKHGQDPRKAMNEALEIAYWTDPATRAQAIQSQVEQHLNQSADTDDKKRRAAALSGAGGVVPRTPPAAQPLTKDQREAAMISEIATAMNGSLG